jgi:hypothetical protein
VFSQINVTYLLRERVGESSLRDIQGVVVVNPEYFKKLDSLISKTPKR